MEAREMLLEQGSLEFETNDLGYFGRAFSGKFEDEFWGKYDVYLPMALTMLTTGILWIITTILNICKYTYMYWDLSCHVLFYSMNYRPFICLLLL